MTNTQNPPQSLFSGYQKFVIAVLAFLQFTIILDFMILSPLGAILMPALNITTSQFGLVVSAYAFSAGASGLLAAGFADRFDRKKLLLFFYTGFVIGTLMCGLAPNYHALLIARIVTGIFGGVIGSISFAIVTDLFSFEKRGRVMGVIQTSFAASQILGLPLGLFLSNHWGWHMPFILIVVVSVLVGAVIFKYLKPIDSHLQLKTDKKPFHHLMHTLTQPRYVQGFASAALISIGGFMMMPFGSAFNVHNLGVSLDDLPVIYMISGVASIIIGPLMGRLSDKYGKLQIFAFGSLLAAVSALIYTRLGVVPLWFVILISVVMYSGVSARMISSSALLSALPAATDRGSYMAVSSSIQQISGGVAAAIAGMIVIQNPGGSLGRFEIVGDVMVGTTIITVLTMAFINRVIQRKSEIPSIPPVEPATH
ncbi:MFS transporter [Bdellovibrio sp. HCB2-146]|uniref:MFS transporter n=1 Tax=Bdellovibrio sp. HCB2-146 TaxID=3394362 RepID=UPI0039BCFBD6